METATCTRTSSRLLDCACVDRCLDRGYRRGNLLAVPQVRPQPLPCSFAFAVFADAASPHRTGLSIEGAEACTSLLSPMLTNALFVIDILVNDARKRAFRARQLHDGMLSLSSPRARHYMGHVYACVSTKANSWCQLLSTTVGAVKKHNGGNVPTNKLLSALAGVDLEVLTGLFSNSLKGKNL
eukprot:5968808-Pyramimonas_sp.AAC.1